MRSGFSSQLHPYILNKIWFFSCDRILKQAIYVPDFSTSQNRVAPAERLSDNREVAIADVIKNSGVQAIAADGDFTTVKDAVDFHLRQLADYLIHGNGETLPGGRTGGKNSSVDPLFAAVGAITFAYLRNRICAPRDMSAGAATAFRAAIDKLLTSVY
ncbi:glutathione S-transferase-like protein [Nostoc commune NIES-4072]|uniref:Glutathione S-transferase-like protein n=1 Tax=Nostoc commune NIES-4072 TaxID=2005467 RepID=A0A2R5FK89_NOSCO|nr:hypothetical protein [Nostoc commune]BBD63969.1 glutathione S-transferase-like protein [Nostoc commune HK-02]GBG18705.1 glutathione S-transferase-like protein [Nostoc commune NIES-4072]